MNIMVILQGILAPLVPDIFLATIISGLLFGALYNAKLDLPRSVIWHFMRVGINFLFMLFVFRSLYAVVVGAAVSNPLGWIGIGILWLTYCTFILLGQVAADKFEDYRESRKKKII